MMSLASVTEGFEYLVASVAALQGERNSILRVSQNTHHHTPWKKSALEILNNHRGTVSIITHTAKMRVDLCSLVGMCGTDMISSFNIEDQTICDS